MNWFTKWLMKGNGVTVKSPCHQSKQVPPISEPVLSLVGSLKNREWTFEMTECTIGTAYKCTHLQKKLKFTVYKTPNFGLVFQQARDTTAYELSCCANWMTTEESKLVATTAFKVITDEYEEWKIANNWKEREKFMILTKEPK